MTGRVLILGADGFIGRHIAFALRDAGYEVVASARRTGPLAEMGFATLRADLTDPACHDAAFWAPHLQGGIHIVNTAGILTGTEATFTAVHETAPKAAYAALDGGHALLISAVGIGADTPFGYWRRRGEEVARAAGATILRPGLVLGDTSYGGSSLLRALSVLPFRRPIVGTGAERINPIHAEDLARITAACLAAPPGPGPKDGAWEAGGPETLTQEQLSALIRRWFGLRPAPALILPAPLTRALGRIGDALRIGPISRTSVAQIESGLETDPAPLTDRTGIHPAPASRFLFRRPTGTQDLWQARLYLVKPLIRLTLALMWLVSGALGLLLPADHFLPLFASLPMSDTALTALARTGGIADLALAAALLRDWRPRLTAYAQLALVIGYTTGLTLLTPGLWLAPFGELLKNLPVMALILTHLALTEER